MSYPNPIDFTGKVAVVTGGTKGIGFVIAENLLRAGATVVVVLMTGSPAAGTPPDTDADAIALAAIDPHRFAVPH